MSTMSGTPVSTGKRHERPKSDLERLLDYMEERFAARRQEMLALFGECADMRSRHDLVKLGVLSLQVAMELDTWIEISRDALDNARGSELETSRQMTEDDTKGRRAPADEVKAKAAAQLSPLTTIQNVLKSTRDRAIQINRWCQVQQQTMREMEYGEALEIDSDLTPMFEAPLTDTFSRARHAGV